MINEQKNEQNTLIKTKNSWLVSENINIFSLYYFFLNYLKRQKFVLFFAVVIIPIGLLAQSIFINSYGIKILPLSLGITFIATGTSVTMYLMMGFLIDLKMSVVYKRIGLLGIKPFGFIMIVLLYCFTLVLISDFLVLIASLIISLSFKVNLADVYTSVVFLFFFISLFSTMFVIMLMLVAVVMINSRTMQSLITGLFSVLFVGGAFVGGSLIPAFYGLSYSNVLLSQLGLGIIFATIFLLIGLTILLGWAIIWIFKWDN